jgi:hypothetical protein
MKMRPAWFKLFRLLVVLLALPVALNAGGAEAIDAGAVGPAALWRPSGDSVRQFQECGIDLRCVETVMRRGGASPQAADFTRLFARQGLGVPGYLETFREMGRVDLATVMIPGRANTNQVYFMVNGTPELVSTEDHLQKIDIRQDPLYPALAAKYPKIMLWGGGPAFKTMERRSGGGQRFVFAYFLRNGCHACEVGGSAWVAFDFDARGTFRGTRLLHLTKSPPD